MAAIRETEAAGRRDDATALDVTSALEAQHWRALATEREAALRALTRRPLVRIAVGVDRRLAPAARYLGSRRGRVRSALDLIDVAAAGVRARPRRRRRRAALARQIARLGPVPRSRAVSVITIAGGAKAYRDAATAAGIATGDVLCFVPERVESPDPGWMARLTDAIVDDVVAAAPTLVQPDRRGRGVTEHDLLVRSEGFEVDLDPDDAPVILARSSGDDPTVGREPTDIVAASLRCLAVDRAAYLAAGGLGLASVDDSAAVDLCARLRQHGGRIQHVPDAVVFDDHPVPSRDALRRPIDPGSPAWRSLVERRGPALVRAARPRSSAATRWVITTAVPSARLATRWGDWHFAEGLAGALQRLGEDVRVETHDHADALSTRSCDLHLVLHGKTTVRRTPGQRHVLWVISHPETLDVAECEAADLVLVASPRFAASLRRRTSTPVEVLLQATDAGRFSPQPPDPQQEHPVTVVAKTRNVLRPVVADALAAGIRPAIYGSGWRDLVDPDLVVADHIDNEVLATVYSSAGVVLNDHWDTMRAWGFVSNRIFDVLACGTPIISDHLDEIRDLFGDAVPTYRTSQELGELVACALEQPGRARARAARGRAAVLAHHTFDHRAQELIELVAHHDLRSDHRATKGRT
ncbi:MAG: glycosyltransferase [Acidimicrobiales bacterium]